MKFSNKIAVSQNCETFRVVILTLTLTPSTTGVGDCRQAGEKGPFGRDDFDSPPRALRAAT